MENLYRAIQSCDEQSIIVTLDGDDWFAHQNVLSELNTIYTTQEVWYTHGTLVEYPHGAKGWSIPIPPEIISENTFRQFRCPSHLRTFYAWLFNKIELEDLMYEDFFLPMTWDMGIMYPIAEMAGSRHVFISTVSYVYNMANQINDNKVNAELQRELDRYIRNKKPYSLLVQPPNDSQQNFQNKNTEK